MTSWLRPSWQTSTARLCWTSRHRRRALTSSLPTSRRTGEFSRLSTPQTVVFDRTPPSLVLTSPQDPQVTGKTVTVAGTTEAGASLAINGQPAAVDAAGNFSVDMSLTLGPNELNLVVTDRAGNEVKLNSVLIVE